MGTLAISSLATGAVHQRCDELDAATRDEIRRRERGRERITWAAEWLGVLLLLFGMLPIIHGLGTRTRVLD